MIFALHDDPNDKNFGESKVTVIATNLITLLGFNDRFTI
jgi:hypothetical protein